MGNAEGKVSSYGYRVIKVAPDSPAQRAGLVEFLDFIVDISSPNDQTPFSGNYTDFFKIVQNSEDQEATMKVYNMLHRKTRVLTITPSKKWKDADSLLGALVRYEEYATAHERVLRIAQVHPNSPTMLAGLQPESDYILGTPQYLYTDLNELAKFIEMTQEKETIKSLEISIYSSQTNTVRSTLLMPNKNWGGQGYLGCEFALGILNQLPHLEDSMHVSNLGEIWNGDSNGQIDRLDDDDETTDESHHNCDGSHHHHHDHHHKQVENDSTPRGAEQDQEVKEVIPEFKLRPPTDAEINKSHSPHANGEDSQTPKNDLSQELTNQRMKLLHISNNHKSHPKTATKATIKPLRSTSNPFNNSSSAENEVVTQNFQSEESIVKEKTEAEAESDSLPQILQNNNTSSILEEASSKEQADHENTQEASSLVEDKHEETLATPATAINVKTEEVPVPVAVPVRIQEKQVCKTTIEYNFFSKKLNGDYKILSSNLFSIEQLGQLN